MNIYEASIGYQTKIHKAQFFAIKEFTDCQLGI